MTENPDNFPRTFGPKIVVPLFLQLGIWFSNFPGEQSLLGAIEVLHAACRTTISTKSSISHLRRLKCCVSVLDVLLSIKFPELEKRNQVICFSLYINVGLFSTKKNQSAQVWTHVRMVCFSYVHMGCLS